MNDNTLGSISDPEYAARAATERQHYSKKTHDLPPICFYWLNRFILPQLASLGYNSADDFFQRNLQRVYEQSGGRRHFLSIGSGNCETELRLARELRKSGACDFVIHCLDLNEQLLERGQVVAAQEGLSAHIQTLCGDFNSWQPAREYDAVIANHALHHVLQLENLFDAIHRSLRRNGVLITSDMIGRNGHRRWPEALTFVQQFWNEMPASYRYNRQLDRQETEYPDWDCAAEGMGFEGIRAQDILPLLVDRFHFQFFYAFSNVTDPFIDRSFGPNFDPDIEWDRQFIERVHTCDETEIDAGRIKPTHMLAVLSREQTVPLRCKGPRTPEFCLRRP